VKVINIQGKGEELPLASTRAIDHQISLNVNFTLNWVDFYMKKKVQQRRVEKRQLLLLYV